MLSETFASLDGTFDFTESLLFENAPEDGDETFACDFRAARSMDKSGKWKGKCLGGAKPCRTAPQRTWRSGTGSTGSSPWCPWTSSRMRFGAAAACGAGIKTRRRPRRLRREIGLVLFLFHSLGTLLTFFWIRSTGSKEALQLLQDTVVTSEGGQSQVHAKRAGEGLVEGKARGKVEEADGKAKTERAESKGIDKVREELRKGSQADGLCATGDGFREGKRETSKPRRADLQAEVAQKSQQLEETTEENKKLKVCLEELQAKVRQLMGNCKERGMEKEIDEIATNIGLKRVLSCPSRFDILYQDRSALLLFERSLVRRSLASCQPDDIPHFGPVSSNLNQCFLKRCNRVTSAWAVKLPTVPSLPIAF